MTSCLTCLLGWFIAPSSIIENFIKTWKIAFQVKQAWTTISLQWLIRTRRIRNKPRGLETLSWTSSRSPRPPSSSCAASCPRRSTGYSKTENALGSVARNERKKQCLSVSTVKYLVGRTKSYRLACRMLTRSYAPIRRSRLGTISLPPSAWSQCPWVKMKLMPRNPLLTCQNPRATMVTMMDFCIGKSQAARSDTPP